MDEPGQDESVLNPLTTLRQNVRIVLVRPLQSGNVGAVARAMKNFGLRDLAVVAPPALDIDRARWMAPGAAELLDGARYVSSVAEAVADCARVVATTARQRHSPWPAWDVEAFSPVVFAEAGRTAILFGPEDHGLNNEELAHAHGLLHIATDVHASLNLGQAVLLVSAALFAEARRRGAIVRPEGRGRRGGPARGAPPGATAEREIAAVGEIEPLVSEWMESVELGSYMRGHEPVLVSGTLRRILQRAALDRQEISILRGMLRKMRWKMRHAGSR